MENGFLLTIFVPDRHVHLQNTSGMTCIGELFTLYLLKNLLNYVEKTVMKCLQTCYHGLAYQRRVKVGRSDVVRPQSKAPSITEEKRSEEPV